MVEASDLTGDEYSEETSRRIDEELRTLLDAGHARVRETLSAKRSVLDALAKLLIEKEVVTRTALGELLRATPERSAPLVTGIDGSVPLDTLDLGMRPGAALPFRET